MFKAPQVQQWSFNTQFSLTSSTMLQVGYVGSSSANIEVTRNINQPTLTVNPDSSAAATFTGPTIAADNIQSRRRYLGMSTITQAAEIAVANYNSLQVSVQKRMSRGLKYGVSYTFSKTIDNASEAFSTFDGAFNAISQSPFDISRAERGISNYDYPNVFGLLWVYDLPFAKNQKGLLGHVLGGWEINGTYRYSSGQPWTVEQNVGQGLCDPTNFTGATLDSCRPFLGNKSLPFNEVGMYCDGTVATCVNASNVPYPVGTLVSVNAGCTSGQCAATPVNAAHFIVNNIPAEKIFGTPFSPLRRTKTNAICPLPRLLDDPGPRRYIRPPSGTAA